MAGIFNKLLNSIKIDDDEYDDEEEFEPGEEFDDLDYTEEPKKRSYTSSRKYDSALSLDDDFEDEDDLKEEQPKRVFKSSRKQAPVVSMPKRGSNEIWMFKPASFSDSKEICDTLRMGTAVIINMEGMNIDVCQRITDFVAGATHSIDGSLRMISAYILIATPKTIELSGDFLGSAGGGSNTLNYNI